MQLFQDRVDGRGPVERLAFGVVRDHVVGDALCKLLDAYKGAAADGRVSDQREETFDLIERGTISRNEVNFQRGHAASHALIFGLLCVA